MTGDKPLSGQRKQGLPAGEGLLARVLPRPGSMGGGRRSRWKGPCLSRTINVGRRLPERRPDRFQCGLSRFCLLKTIPIWAPFQLSQCQWCQRCQRLRAGMLRSSQILSLTAGLTFVNWHPQLGDEVPTLNLHGGSHQPPAPDPQTHRPNLSHRPPSPLGTRRVRILRFFQGCRDVDRG